jgi:hypothetical protein
MLSFWGSEEREAEALVPGMAGREVKGGENMELWCGKVFLMLYFRKRKGCSWSPEPLQFEQG